MIISLIPFVSDFNVRHTPTYEFTANVDAAMSGCPPSILYESL